MAPRAEPLASVAQAVKAVVAWQFEEAMKQKISKGGDA